MNNFIYFVLLLRFLNSIIYKEHWELNIIPTYFRYLLNMYLNTENKQKKLNWKAYFFMSSYKLTKDETRISELFRRVITFHIMPNQ